MTSSWTQIGSDLFGDKTGDGFGFTGISLSSDGSILAVGASTNDDNGTDSGHVQIFENLNNSWSQVGSAIAGEAAYDQSGVSVDISDDGNIRYANYQSEEQMNEYLTAQGHENIIADIV